MMRGWILAASVGAICLTGEVRAQQVAGTLMERLQMGDGQSAQRQRSDDSQFQDDRQRRDDHVQLTAGEMDDAPAARQSASQAPNRKPRSSFMSRFKMPNLLPQSMRSSKTNDSGPQMPYDESEVRAAERPARSAARPQSTTKRQESGALPQAGQRYSTPEANAHAASRVARSTPRSSPAVGARRNELADALSGLSPARRSPSSGAAAPQREAEAEVAMPPATGAEELPSYLSEGAAPAKRYSPPSPSNAVDLQDALLNGDAPSREAGSQATESADAEVLGSLPPAKSAARPAVPSVQAPQSAAAKRPTVRSDAVTTPPVSTAQEQFRAAPSESIGDVAAEAPHASLTPQTPPAVVQSRPAASSALAGTGLRPRGDVLFSSRHPVISSNIEGPQRIVVGRQVEYRVTLENKGDVSARDLTAVIAAPAEADIVDAVGSNGEVERASVAGQSNDITWRLYELGPGASQTLTLQIVPRSGRQLQLGVEWSHAPVGGHATVEVQEPKLQMEITGPSDVLFGKSQRYGLTLTNPGNGAAEAVAIELTPPGGGPDSLVRHTIGLLGPGESKKIELELTAREAGELPIKAVATATGDLRAEAVKNVLCRKPDLQVDWRGPDKKFAGSIATYYFRVRNPGTATAEQVAVEVLLPAGVELVKPTEGHTWDADRRIVSWPAAALNAGEERFTQLECRMAQPGVNRMEVSAKTSAGDLRDAKTATITVEALADLKLDVSDPQGVVPVGEMALYEIRIQNRGMIAARGVNVVAMFSAGLDPSHVEGGQHTIRDGRVSFRTIDNLAAGGETVLRIHAKASQSGTHVFRTEVSCEELEVKLAAEETTRFFTEEERWADASTAYSQEGETTTH